MKNQTRADTRDAHTGANAKTTSCSLSSENLETARARQPDTGSRYRHTNSGRHSDDSQWVADAGRSGLAERDGGGRAQDERGKHMGAVPGYRQQELAQLNPFDIKLPELDTSRLTRAARLDEMGLYNSRASYTRGTVTTAQCPMCFYSKP